MSKWTRGRHRKQESVTAGIKMKFDSSLLSSLYSLPAAELIYWDLEWEWEWDWDWQAPERQAHPCPHPIPESARRPPRAGAA